MEKKSIAVKVGNIIIGGGYPVTVQSMWKAPLGRVDESLAEKVNALFDRGCHILRFAVPDRETAEGLGKLSGMVKGPLVADIHFDHTLALRCLDFPISKIRINPGNIGDAKKVEEVVRKAMDKGVPIRVGVNGGSLPRGLKGEQEAAEAMVKAAEMELEILEKLGFRQVIFSLKSSDLFATMEANRLFRKKYDYPLHLGVTEAGPLVQGIVKSTVALYGLLKEGIGDTIRVSLSDSPENEVMAGKQIVALISPEGGGPDLVSCPTCGRTIFDVKRFLEKIQPALGRINKKVSLAVMGCPVNGPGEAKHADLGITGSGEQVIIFKKGKILHRTTDNEAEALFLKELDNL